MFLNKRGGKKSWKQEVTTIPITAPLLMAAVVVNCPRAISTQKMGVSVTLFFIELLSGKSLSYWKPSDTAFWILQTNPDEITIVVMLQAFVHSGFYLALLLLFDLIMVLLVVALLVSAQHWSTQPRAFANRIVMYLHCPRFSVVWELCSSRSSSKNGTMRLSHAYLHDDWLCTRKKITKELFKCYYSTSNYFNQ